MLNEELRQFIQTRENASMKFVEWSKENDQGIYLYGAGHYLRFAVQFMNKYHIKIKGILDSNHEGEYQGIPITKLSEFLKMNPNKDNWFVISAPAYADEMIEQLSIHFTRENIFFFEMLLYAIDVSDPEMYRQYVLLHWAEFLELSKTLADNKSRETLEAVVKGRISGEVENFQQCYVPDQYYPSDIIQLTDGEVMVELGSNKGETLLKFIERCPNYRSVYCFEPDKVCIPSLDRIKENMRGGGTIHIVTKGAWDCSTVLKFCSDGEGAGNAHIQLEEDGEAIFQIETTAVDETVKEPITFLKMDVEGAELRAVYGARKQIIENHPKLAISVYHKYMDILEIWSYLRKLVPEYQFYLRHHGRCAGDDTILYAVAKMGRSS